MSKLTLIWDSRVSFLRTSRLKVERGTKLKGRILTEMKKVDFFPRAIDFKACLPFDQAWSRTYKNEVP